MESIDDFLMNKGLDMRDGDLKIPIQDVRSVMKDYAILVREEQIQYCAVGSAHYTAVDVRHTPDQLDNDFSAHMNVCRVKI